MAVKPGSANRDNMQEAPNNAADSVGLMRESGYWICLIFALYS